jgi:GR25 family glycosyltransferase involved in LPS biosynthesis
MKTFVINLDRRQDRLEYMKNHLQFHEIPSFEKISAIDYKDFVSLDKNNEEYVDYEKINKTDLLENMETKYFCPSRDQFELLGFKHYDRENDLLTMSLTEVCVAKSHKKAWKEAMNYDYSLILEDDITFTHRMPPLLNYIQNECNLNFDIFLLGWATGDHASDIQYLENINSPYVLQKIEYAIFLQAYVLTKDMAKRLYESTIIGPVDEHVAALYQEINCYGISASSQTQIELTDNRHSSENLKNGLIM